MLMEIGWETKFAGVSWPLLALQASAFLASMHLMSVTTRPSRLRDDVILSFGWRHASWCWVSVFHTQPHTLLRRPVFDGVIHM